MSMRNSVVIDRVFGSAFLEYFAFSDHQRTAQHSEEMEQCLASELSTKASIDGNFEVGD